jgi:hypothetical protein
MKITGKITDINGLPLGKTTIKKITGTKANEIGVFSKDNGFFELESDTIAPNDIFQISYLGFTPQTYKASVLQNKTIKLDQYTEEIEPVLVVGSVNKKTKEMNNNFKLHLNKHKTLYAGIGGLLGLILIFTSIKKR